MSDIWADNGLPIGAMSQPQVYVGQTRSSKLIPRLQVLGWGEMTCPGEVPPRRHPWAYDNGAYRNHKALLPFNAAQYRRDLAAIANMANDQQPDFIVAPDIVAGGWESLRMSVQWLTEVRRLAPGVPAYLVVQDGMTLAVEPQVLWFDGVFVGGSRPWKLATGEQWVELAHRCGCRCHVGRCGGKKTIAWALRIGCDSIDSCLPQFGEGNLQRALGALEPTQGELFDA